MISNLRQREFEVIKYTYKHYNRFWILDFYIATCVDLTGVLSLVGLGVGLFTV